MTTDVVAAQVSTSVRVVAELLVGRHISAIPVVDTDCRVVGVVSEADVLHHRHTDQTAGTMMSKPAINVLADQAADVAADRMEQHGVKRLPVVDDMERLVGILSRSDLVRAYARGRLPSRGRSRVPLVLVSDGEDDPCPTCCQRGSSGTADPAAAACDDRGPARLIGRVSLIA